MLVYMRRTVVWRSVIIRIPKISSIEDCTTSERINAIVSFLVVLLPKFKIIPSTFVAMSWIFCVYAGALRDIYDGRLWNVFQSWQGEAFLSASYTYTDVEHRLISTIQTYIFFCWSTLLNNHDLPYE